MKRSVCVLFALAAGLYAQPPGPPRGMGGPRRIDGLTRRLTLDSAQKEKATAIYDAADKTSKALRTTVKQSHEALALAVQKNDGVAIDRAALQIGTLMAQELSVQSKADAAFRQTLTAEQQTKLDQVHTHGGPPPAPDGAGPRPQRGRRPPPPPAE